MNERSLRLAAGVADRRSGRPVAPVGQRAQARFGAGHGEREQERHRQRPHDGKPQLGLAEELARERHGALARQREAGPVGAGLPGAGDEATAVEAQPHGNGPRTSLSPSTSMWTAVAPSKHSTRRLAGRLRPRSWAPPNRTAAGPRAPVTWLRASTGIHARDGGEGRAASRSPRRPTRPARRRRTKLDDVS